MHSYGVRDVEKLLRLPRSTIRALITAGFVTPARGPRNAWLFSFQDLIVLRTAQSLATANIPHRRIVKSLKELRSRLPETMPLSGLSISAIADHVVVREGGNRWHAESGQYVLAFEGDPATGSLRVIEQAQVPVETGTWTLQGIELESSDTDAARRAYERAIAADPSRLDARINLGRLLHELHRFDESEQVYRDAIAIRNDDPLLFFNLGVLLDDADRKPEAMQAYEAALRLDPQLADCHYNLALLYEELDQPKQAIRHMSQYRRLMGARE
ncbi:tetratricopeptide repeat protein [Lysobacter sp. CFH 32150]|uniref:tetratricopeptide repeat protein n=1 Tax=Lysobacter sp. CFH 32150 TaxID=2927128 RepID=UPI001FA70015|nr:tetratricopeptide repeat protein [Lysobacter sp. CFH 32150]MCI4568868.1 tetratricopeptide repeat protein [Lysobacter sp. CFH 32150]